MKAAILVVMDRSPHFIRATRLQAQGKHDAAIREYESELAANPADVQSLKQIARCHMARGRWKKAVAVMERLFAVRPATYIEFQMRGDANLASGWLDDAERDATAALKDIKDAERLGELAGLATARTQAEKLLRSIKRAKAGKK